MTVVQLPGRIPVAVATLTLIGTLACGASSSNRATIVEMDAVIVTADGTPIDDPELAPLSDAEIFDAANEQLRSGDVAEALRRYNFLVSHSTDEDYVRAAIYNAGLCYEALDEWDAAGRAYERVVERWPASDDATDALFRWAEARTRLGDWEGVAPIMERALRRARLTLVDRIEGHLRWANAAIEIRDYAASESHYREALGLNREAQMEGGGAGIAAEPLAAFHPLIVQANFGLGRTYHELFLEIKLVLPQRSIERALMDKAQLMEQARIAYLDAVRAGHPYWSVAAGFMIGQIYEDFFLDVLATQVPTDFNELTVEVYFDELRAFLQPVVERALFIYEDNLAMAERFGSDSEWVDETRAAIRRVQSYLFDENVQQEQERLILTQEHPHSARDPQRRWRAGL